MRARTKVEARHDRAPRPAAGPDGSWASADTVRVGELAADVWGALTDHSARNLVRISRRRSRCRREAPPAD
jgi:hypothetical protein